MRRPPAAVVPVAVALLFAAEARAADANPGSAAEAARPAPVATLAADASPAAPAPAHPASANKGRLRGEVGFSRNQKVTGAIVALTNQEEKSRLILTATNPDGIFKAEGIPEG